MEGIALSEQLNELNKYVHSDVGNREIEASRWKDLDLVRERFQGEFEVLGIGHESFAIVDPDDPESVLSFPRTESMTTPKGVLPFS